MASATLIEELPFTDAGVDPQNGDQEEDQIGCTFNVPSLDYKFTVMTGGTIEVGLSSVTGVSDPVAYFADTIDETDPTQLTVTDNLGGAGEPGSGCFVNDAGLDGFRSFLVVPGDIFFVLVANEGTTDITFSSPDGAEVEMVLGVDAIALSQVSIFPNPASDVLNIDVPASVELNGATLYDVLRKATSVSLSNGQINVSGLSRGVYILNVDTSAGTLTEKVIIE